MISAALLARKDLSASDKIVLCGMCLNSYKEGFVSRISHSALGVVCGLARTTVMASVKHLVAAGVIEAVGKPERQVTPYRIVDGFYRAGAEAPVAEKRAVVLNVCGKCKKRRKVNKTGYCESCRIQSEVERRMRHLA